jgi:hypothetical protein
VQWHHFKCYYNGQLEINEEAIIRCDQCYTSASVFCWAFDCGNHPADIRFQAPAIETIASVISGATEYIDYMGGKWYRKLLRNLQANDPNASNYY